MTKAGFKNLIFFVSITIATFFWLGGNIPFYNHGCVITPTMRYCVSQWYKTNFNYYLVLGIGEALILAYGVLIFAFYARSRAKNAIAITMSAVWGIWIFLLTIIFSPPPSYYACPAGGCGFIFPYLYAFFWLGEISALVVAVLLVFLHPRK